MLIINVLQFLFVFRRINSMLLLDKSIAFIRRKACFLSMKRMLLSREKRKNRPVLSNRFTFACYLLPVTYHLIAASDSRRLLHGDRNFGRNLTIEGGKLTVINKCDAWVCQKETHPHTIVRKKNLEGMGWRRLQLAALHLPDDALGEAVDAIGVVVLLEAGAIEPGEGLIEPSLDRSEDGLDEVVGC